MNQGRKKILMIGECMIELNGEPLSNMHQYYGGDTLNTAVYLSRCLGGTHSISYATVMGQDPLSERIISCWQSEGIETQAVLRDTQRQTGLYLIQLDDVGERTFLYWRQHSAAKYLLQHAQYSLVQDQIDVADIIYISGITLAILPQHNRFMLLDALEAAAKRGADIVFDTNYRPALWDCVEQTQMCYERLFHFTSLALVTDEDESALWQASRCSSDL